MFYCSKPGCTKGGEELLEEFKNEYYGKDEDRFVLYAFGDGTEEKMFREAGFELRAGDIRKIHESLWVTKPGTVVVIKERGPVVVSRSPSTSPAMEEDIL
jgi:hypothetical protein